MNYQFKLHNLILTAYSQGFLHGYQKVCLQMCLLLQVGLTPEPTRNKTLSRFAIQSKFKLLNYALEVILRFYGRMNYETVKKLTAV